MSLEVLEFELPTYWAGQLINNDWSCAGLTFNDHLTVLLWQKTHCLCCAVDISEEETRLGWSTYTWLIDKGTTRLHQGKPQYQAKELMR